MNDWNLSTSRVQQMIDLLRQAAIGEQALDIGELWALCDEAADFLEDMMHYEQSHGLRTISTEHGND